MSNSDGSPPSENGGGFWSRMSRSEQIMAAIAGALVAGIFAVIVTLIGHSSDSAQGPQARQSISDISSPQVTSPEPSHSQVTTVPAPSSPSSNQSSSGPSSSSTFTSGTSGGFTTPTSGTDVSVGYVSASGSVRNLPHGYRLDLFLKFADLGVYYAAGDPNTTLTVARGKWSGRIGVGSHAPTAIYIYLVELSPSSVTLMNTEVNYQNNGFPSITALGTILARVQLNLNN